MWDHRGGSAHQYYCTSAIYLLPFLDLEYNIINNRAVVSPGLGKYVIDGLNARIKQMLKLAIIKLLNTKLIRDDPIFKSSCRFMKIKN